MKIRLRPPTEPNKRAGIYCATLVCNLVGITLARDAAHFYFPEGDCCDMSGAIKIAETLSAGIKCIVTYSGAVPDTIYQKQRGEWRSCN